VAQSRKIKDFQIRITWLRRTLIGGERPGHTASTTLGIWSTIEGFILSISDRPDHTALIYDRRIYPQYQWRQSGAVHLVLAGFSDDASGADFGCCGRGSTMRMHTGRLLIGG
jgi:hypothetical protein